jgi:hypothetical protein
VTPAQRVRRVATLRRWHAAAIDENPTVVEFDRPTTVEDPATGSAVPVVPTPHVGPVTIRIYQDRYARETVAQPQGGTVNLGNRWGLIAPYDADLKGDPHGEQGDQFDSPDGHFRVREVFHHRLGPRMPEDVWGIECDIVRVA